MKEAIEDFKQNEVVIAEEKQVIKELKLLGSQRKIPGHILWELNTKTGELKPSTFKKVDVRIRQLKNYTAHDQVEVRPSCFYFQALNRKNAIKYLKKMAANAIVKLREASAPTTLTIDGNTIQLRKQEPLSRSKPKR